MITDKDNEVLQEIKELVAEFKNENTKFSAELLLALTDMKVRINKITLSGIEISFGGSKHE